MKHVSTSDNCVEMPEKSGIVACVTSPDSSPDASQLVETAASALYPNYAQPPLVMDHGAGSVLFDTQGKRYIDFFAGIAVSTLGHGHPKLVAALKDQAEKLVHLSNYYYTAPNIQLAERLTKLTGLDRAFFCNSGTEANEAALKLARRYFYDQGQKERYNVIAFANSFHGRTLGSLTATGQPKYREGFGPIGGVIHVPFGDLDAVRAALDDSVCAILVEPIQGEGGVVVAPPGFLQGLRKLCDESGALLMLDEIQTGIGRTTKFLAAEHDAVLPDVVTLAKALGAGVPIGAMLCREKYSSALPPGSHGTTFGGNPLASSAALAVLSELMDAGLLARVAQVSQVLESRLDQIAEKHAAVSMRRGRGLLQGLVLADPSTGPKVLAALRNEGLLVTFAGGCAIRITPPLVISDAELDEGLTILDRVLGDIHE